MSLNLKCIGGLVVLDDIIENSSSFKEDFIFCLELSGIIPEDVSIKQRDGYSTHHQFSPLSFTYFYF